MALTFVPLDEFHIGTKRGVAVRVEFDNSYPTGGYPVTGQDVFLPQLMAVEVKMPCVSGYIVAWEYMNQTIQVWQVGGTNSPLVEIPAGTDLSGLLTVVFALAN